MSTHWFHDHMFELHRGERVQGHRGDDEQLQRPGSRNEAIKDGVNLRLPSGRLKDLGNLEYDVNLVVADKAFDPNGQSCSICSTPTASSATSSRPT